jgi:hypothetical protein
MLRRVLVVPRTRLRVLGAAPLEAQTRARSEVFNSRDRDGMRRTHTSHQLPRNHSSRYGGRAAHFRVSTRNTAHQVNNYWFKDQRLEKYNIDVWLAQQTLRKKWKGRDWDVVEMPFALAPKALQQVVPELHTELPKMTAPAKGDFQNIRSKVFNREDLQDALFPNHAVKPYPQLQRRSEAASARALDSFFGAS